VPHSANEGKKLYQDWLSNFTEIKSILDVGPGAGIYSKLSREVNPNLIIDCVEAFKPYVEKFGLKQKYDNVFSGNILNIKITGYDLIILGDVLEHFAKADAVKCWKKAKFCSRFVWLSIPIFSGYKPWYRGYRQPTSEYKVNPFEEHKYDWEFEEIVSELGPFVGCFPFKTVIIFLAEGGLCKQQ